MNYPPVGSAYDTMGPPAQMEGGQACGGGTNACFDDGPAGGAPPGQQPWAYVGQGRGGYEKVETLVWVGAGNGSFDKDQLPPPRPVNRIGTRSQIYVGIMVTLVLTGVCCLVASMLSGPAASERDLSEEGQREPDSPTPLAATGPALDAAGAQAESFQCDGPSDLWPQAQKDWCCANRGVGCPELDCEAGYSTWEKGWSDGKKVWCCQHRQRGCQSGADSGEDQGAFDCDAGLDQWQDSWAVAKKDWCCWHFNKGCPMGEADSGVNLRRA